MPPDRSQILNDLRDRISRIEGRHEVLSDGSDEANLSARWTMGSQTVDDHLPSTGLPIGAVHEFQGLDFGDSPAACGFALSLMRRLPDQTGQVMTGRRAVLWCQRRMDITEFGRPYGPGLRMAGLDPASLITVTTRREEDVLWAVEEGVRSGVLTAVIGEISHAGLVATRRLSLAAAETSTPCFLLRWPGVSAVTAASSRWRISTVPGAADRWDARGPGAPYWQIELDRCRSGRPGNWTLTFDDTANCFHMVAAMADRQAQPRRAARVLSFARAG